MEKKIAIATRREFGKQFKKYRDQVGLNQEEIASLFNTKGTFIAKVENGKAALSLDLLDKYSSTFGVTYYEMGNPNFPIPPLKKMPAALHAYLEQVKQNRKDRKNQPRMKLAAYLDMLLDTKFLQKAHTAAEIATEIEKANGVGAEPGKVTALLTKHPRNKRVRTIPGEEWGGRGNLYELIDKKG